jgi:uncharacterized membrane protein
MSKRRLVVLTILGFSAAAYIALIWASALPHEASEVQYGINHHVPLTVFLAGLDLGIWGCIRYFNP